MGEEAGRLGRSLLADVEVHGLGEIFKELELILKSREEESTDSPPRSDFSGIPDLDTLLPHHSTPIIELIAPPTTHHPSSAGKTSLLYLLITHAILPASFSPTVSLSGKDVAVILFDPLHRFSITRLATIMFTHILTCLRTSSTSTTLQELDPSQADSIKSLVQRSLVHLHILRPTSWPTLLTTLSTLPTYLFDFTRHKSTHRRVHSIILDDIDAFSWAIRGAAADDTGPKTNANPLSKAAAELSTRLCDLSAKLVCGIILTSRSPSPKIFRPALPITLPRKATRPESEASNLGPLVRLAIRRVEVLPFAPAISIEEAEAERSRRWEVVSRGRFECWKVGSAGDGEGFVFRVGEGKVEVEKAEEEGEGK